MKAPNNTCLRNRHEGTISCDNEPSTILRSSHKRYKQKQNKSYDITILSSEMLQAQNNIHVRSKHNRTFILEADTKTAYLREAYIKQPL